MSDYPMLISNKLHSFRNFKQQIYLLLDLFPNYCREMYRPRRDLYIPRLDLYRPRRGL